METKEINGRVFEAMVKNGLINLRNSEVKVNNLNVFPVPDGDTGSNMSHTLDNGIKSAVPQEHLGSYLKQLSSGMLLGARGNSGVILSQIFKGIYISLKDKDKADTEEMAEALIEAYKTAYKGVVKPVEGTLLTVSREGIENIRSQIDDDTDQQTLFTLYLNEMKESLKRTPDLLPVLKKAGVVDSGAMGYILIAEGMLLSLSGTSLKFSIKEDSTPKTTAVPVPAPVLDTSAFTENSEFNYGYCTEFLLQLLNRKQPVSDFNLNDFIEKISPLGDSLVALQDESRVKIHIHTKNPSPVITLAQQYGEFVTFKMENMQLQHNEHVKHAVKEYPPKDLYIMAVTNGDGVERLYTEAGCDYIIEGGDTMNTSTQEFINAFKILNSENIVVLPNNKNIIQAALQAVEIYGQKNITVIPTKNIAEGYYALAMDDSSSSNVQFRIKQMKEGAEYVQTILMSTSVRDCSVNDVEVKEGQKVVIANGELCASSDDYVESIIKGIETVIDDERSAAIIFRNSNFTDEMVNRLEDAVAEKFPFLSLQWFEGNQSIYEIIMGLI